VNVLPNKVETGNHVFRVIETPGHCPGHVAFGEISKGWCFTGDLFISREPKAMRPEEDIYEIARKWGVSAMDALLRLSESSNGRAAVLFQAAAAEPGNEKHLEAILSYNRCLFETDALIPSKGYPNPAGFGTFPKVLGRYVRERKLFSVEDAIRRMTSASADRFGLKERGRLEAGKAADVVVFDPQTISEAPSVGRESAGRPVGIRHVFLNGAHVVKDGAYVAGMRAGRVLRQ
jgi:N-acyl-D-aspartate/D-glutamate deacylase